MGKTAAKNVYSKWTWDHAFKIIEQRIGELVNKPIYRLLDKKIIAEQDKFDLRILNAISEAYSIYNSGDYVTALKKVNLLFNKIDNNIFNQQNHSLHLSLFNLAGLASLGLGNTDTAVKSFESALKLDPTSSDACFGLGQVFYKNEMYDQSKTMFEWAVKNNHENVNALEALKTVNDSLSLPQNHNSLSEEVVTYVEVKN
jgi:tetratricopeptide (TPR) repeat protein